MLKCFVAALLLTLPFNSSFAGSFDSFFSAVHQVETSRRLGPILGDGGKALGPAQIHYETWLDVRATVGGQYSDCANLNYSKKVLIAYLNKYCKEAIRKDNFEVMSRVWNGGPRGDRNPNTLKYWKKIQKELNKSKGK